MLVFPFYMWKKKSKALLSLLHKCPTFVAKQDACTCKSQWQEHVLSNCLTVQMASSTIQYFSKSLRPNVYVIYNSCLGTIIAEYLAYEYQGARYPLINRIDSMLPRICSVKWSHKTWQNVVRTLTYPAAFVSPCAPLFCSYHISVFNRHTTCTCTFWPLLNSHPLGNG